MRYGQMGFAPALLLGLLASVALAQPALAKDKRTAAKPSPTAAQDAAVAAAAVAGQLVTIGKLDDDPAGPQLNAVVAVNPAAASEAAQFAIAAENSSRFTKFWPLNVTGRPVMNSCSLPNAMKLPVTVSDVSSGTSRSFDLMSITGGVTFFQQEEGEEAKLDAMKAATVALACWNCSGSSRIACTPTTGSPR